MKRAHVDFETFSELSVKSGKKNSVGPYKYSCHPSTELLCMGWAIEDEEPELWLPGEPPPARLMDHVREGGLVWAWNAEFEIPVWRNVAVERLGWPDVPFLQWRDSAALALTFALPASLETAGEALGLDVVKDQRGKHLLNKLAQPRRPSKHNPATRWTYDAVPQDYEDLYAYCLQDVRSERAIQRALPAEDLPPEELDTWRMTVEMNLRGWQVDMDSTRRAIAVIERHKVTALSELRALTGGAIQTAGQNDKIRAWLGERGVVMPNMQADTVEEALRQRPPRRCRRVLELRQVLSRAATGKYASQLRLATDDGIVRNLLMYHGTSTGRDAGRGIQIQNYLRDSVSKTEEGVETAIRVLHSDDPIPTIEALYGPVPAFAALLTRSMLTAQPGMVLYSGDYSSIENRISAWYAGSEYALGIFRKGLDEYRMFGKQYYGISYEEVSSKQRNHAKRAVLSLVFGSGWKKFMETCATYGDPCTEEVAKDTIRVYRRELYPEVVAMWYDLEKAAKAAIEFPGRTSRVKRRYASVRFQVSDGFLFMTLASGRRLAYHKPSIQLRKTPWGEMRPTITHMGMTKAGWYRIPLIPGRIFENLVQATARDVMMIGAKSTVAAGYDLVGRVHDELISQVPKGEGDLDEYLELMCPAIDWLHGIPITSEGWTGHRFRK